MPRPDGGFVGDIPCELMQASRKFVPAATTAHEQGLLWSDARTGMTGMTELQTCERTKDAWMLNIQD